MSSIVHPGCRAKDSFVQGVAFVEGKRANRAKAGDSDSLELLSTIREGARVGIEVRDEDFFSFGDGEAGVKD